MKKRYKIAFIICVLLFIVLAGIFVLKLAGVKAPKKEQTMPAPIDQDIESSVPYESPIDFEALQKSNPDIYGWLQIPGTNISYPVVQSAKDDKFYLNHDGETKYYAGGALFTEHEYNKKDFSDPVVAIYGHRMNSGEMFGDLQKLYTDDFEKYSNLVIYTPSEEINYKVFAAVAFSNRHILYYYNGFNDGLMIKEFVNDLSEVRAIGSYFDKDIEVLEDDQLLVLSTCLQGDRTCRFLVVGKRIER